MPSLRFTHKNAALAITDDSNQSEENALMAQFAETFNDNMAIVKDHNRLWAAGDTVILHDVIWRLVSLKIVEDKDGELTGLLANLLVNSI